MTDILKRFRWHAGPYTGTIEAIDREAALATLRKICADELLIEELKDMADKLFEAAFPYGDDILALPVTDLDQTVAWYSTGFGLHEVERRDTPSPTVVMERDGVRIGFSINGIDPGNEGAAILVNDIHRAKQELESRGVTIGNWRIDERDGKRLQVFFVVAPDGLCYYFHQPIADAAG